MIVFFMLFYRIKKKSHVPILVQNEHECIVRVTNYVFLVIFLFKIAYQLLTNLLCLKCIKSAFLFAFIFSDNLLIDFKTALHCRICDIANITHNCSHHFHMLQVKLLLYLIFIIYNKKRYYGIVQIACLIYIYIYKACNLYNSIILYSIGCPLQEVPLHQKLHPHQSVCVLHPAGQCGFH